MLMAPINMGSLPTTYQQLISSPLAISTYLLLIDHLLIVEREVLGKLKRVF